MPIHTRPPTAKMGYMFRLNQDFSASSFFFLFLSFSPCSPSAALSASVLAARIDPANEPVEVVFIAGFSSAKQCGVEERWRVESDNDSGLRSGEAEERVAWSGLRARFGAESRCCEARKAGAEAEAERVHDEFIALVAGVRKVAAAGEPLEEAANREMAAFMAGNVFFLSFRVSGFDSGDGRSAGRSTAAEFNFLDLRIDINRCTAKVSHGRTFAFFEVTNSVQKSVPFHALKKLLNADCC